MTEDVGSADTPTDALSAVEAIDWQRRLSAQVAANAARQAARRNQREEFALSRRRGLARRHAEKLARNRADAVSNPCQPPT